MTTPAHTPENFPPELLAAYADNELDAVTRSRVEAYLAEHPEALAELTAQRAFGPGNALLWERAEVPEPSAAAWNVVRRGIGQAFNPPVPATTQTNRTFTRRTVAAILGIVAIAAVVAFLVVKPAAPQPPPSDAPKPVDVVNAAPVILEVAPPPRLVVPVSQPNPLEGIAVLPMASDDDVILHRVPDTGAGWLPVGHNPLPKTLLFATVEEVHLEDVKPCPAWPKGMPKMTNGPGTMPMIFAAKPR